MVMFLGVIPICKFIYWKYIRYPLTIKYANRIIDRVKIEEYPLEEQNQVQFLLEDAIRKRDQGIKMMKSFKLEDFIP